MTLRIILFIIVLSESFGWWYGAQSFWRSRNHETKQRTTLGILFAGLFTVLGLAQMIATIDSLRYIGELVGCVPKPLMISALVTNSVRSLCAWGIGLAAAGGDGPIRRRINSLVERWK